MAGVESSATPVLSLRLLVDKKKSKVVLAEAGKDFVDVLFSFLKLPMGTIVRLLEKYQQEQKSQATTIGCFNNLYKSVTGLGTASFMTEACKDMLLHPRTVKENQCKRLKLNIDDTEVLKYYMCKNSHTNASHGYSNFRSSRCPCGAQMEKEFTVNQSTYEIFVSYKTLFTITDNMKVESTSTGFTLKTLKGFGYTDGNQLHEMLVEVDHKKVLALLQSILSSDTPLTDVFLVKRSSIVTMMHNMPSLVVKDVTGGEVISISVFSRKLDQKVLYVESGKNFVDFLFTFLVLPLISTWEISGRNIVLGCIGNLCESFNIMSSSQCCTLPWYYRCQNKLFDVCYGPSDGNQQVLVVGVKWCTLVPIDPRGGTYSGFVKEGTTFMVSDDLTISPVNMTSTIFSLKKFNLGFDDIEEHVIKISKTEATNLFRASLITSTALNSALASLLPKKPKQENL